MGGFRVKSPNSCNKFDPVANQNDKEAAKEGKRVKKEDKKSDRNETETSIEVGASSRVHNSPPKGFLDFFIGCVLSFFSLRITSSFSFFIFCDFFASLLPLHISLVVHVYEMIPSCLFSPSYHL